MRLPSLKTAFIPFKEVSTPSGEIFWLTELKKFHIQANQSHFSYTQIRKTPEALEKRLFPRYYKVMKNRRENASHC
jgi:hypothetical protein